jgi:hypothetical protein
MNRLSVFADIAGRAMLSTAGSPKTVAGVVALDTINIASARSEVSGIPKWGKCEYQHAEHIVDFLASQAVSIAVISIDRETDEWKTFESDATILQDAIVLTSKKVAGWVKAPNVLKFILLGSGCAVATGHALGIDKRPKIQNARGQHMIECSVICDQEIEGVENLEVFTSFWSNQRIPKSRLAAFNIDMRTTDVVVTTEQAEPALLLADYVAGLGLAATLPNPGKLPLPLSQEQALVLLQKIKDKGKLALVEEKFNYSYNEIFGEAMEIAKEFGDG